jgi:chromosomal replication initiator protein
MNPSSLEKTWKSALKAIKEEVPASSFQAWIKTASLVDIENNQAVLEVRNEFSRNLLIQNYFRSISKGLEGSLGKPIELVIRVNSKLTTEDYIPSLSSISDSVVHPKITPISSLLNGDRPQENRLNQRFTFDNFIVGTHNQFCHAAALAIAEHQNKGAYNPFFIYGDVGLGKTHIMQAIGNHALSKNPNAKILYFTAESFLNDLISSMRKSKMNEFRAKYRSLDFLLIDDIQFIEGKEATQEEFFHTFNALKENGSQIILTSDRPPKAISRLEPRLCSRFEGGLVADIQMPSYETCLAILSRKAEELRLRLKPEIIDLIARAFPENIRRLEGALVKLQAYINFTDKPLSIELAQRVLQITPDQSGQLIPLKEPATETTIKENKILQQIVALVSARTQVPVSEIFSRDNKQNIKHARQICMSIARTAGMSLNEISEGFNGRGNSAILNSCRRIQQLAKEDSELQSLIQEVNTEITKS